MPGPPPIGFGMDETRAPTGTAPCFVEADNGTPQNSFRADAKLATGAPRGSATGLLRAISGNLPATATLADLVSGGTRA